jgi:hypothetical protein
MNAGVIVCGVVGLFLRVIDGHLVQHFCASPLRVVYSFDYESSILLFLFLNIQ